MRSNSEIQIIIESAFLPLRCESQLYDYYKKIGFKIFDANDLGVIELPEESLLSLSSDDWLNSLITQVRDRLEVRGFKLDPWLACPDTSLTDAISPKFEH